MEKLRTAEDKWTEQILRDAAVCLCDHQIVFDEAVPAEGSGRAFLPKPARFFTAGELAPVCFGETFADLLDLQFVEPVAIRHWGYSSN